MHLPLQHTIPWLQHTALVPLAQQTLPELQHTAQLPLTQPALPELQHTALLPLDQHFWPARVLQQVPLQHDWPEAQQ